MTGPQPGGAVGPPRRTPSVRPNFYPERARLDDTERPLERGDIIAVPAWTEFSFTAASQLDLFTFSDAPVFEKLNLLRTEVTA